MPMLLGEKDVNRLTPLYHAINAERYSRQAQIQSIEALTKRRLIVYSSSAPIDALDVHGFADLLHEFKEADVDLMIQSPGGDVDRAEKVLMLCRSRSSSFKVIVPESAKSAATLIAIGSDEILMSDTSELGPIDPQIQVPNQSGEGYIYRPAQSYLDGLESIKKEAEDADHLSMAYFPLLQQLDPALIDFCHKAVDRSRSFAIKWLEKYMCKDDPDKAKAIANKLLEVQNYLSHGAVIDHEEADLMGLNVTYQDHQSEIWQALWRLHCSYLGMIASGKANKIFESTTVSLVF